MADADAITITITITIIIAAASVDAVCRWFVSFTRHLANWIESMPLVLCSL